MLQVVLVLLTIFASLCVALENPIKTPIRPGRAVHVRRFAKIWNWGGRPSRIQSMTRWRRDLYVCSGVSGGIIYKVTPSGQVSVWFNVAAGMQANGRQMDFTSEMHGGLRGLAFHSKFDKNGLFYVSTMEKRFGPPSNYRYFSRPTSGQIQADSVVLEWKYDKKQKRVINNSYRVVLRIGMPFYDHPIKQIVFRGKFLYIGHGDGSVQSATFGGGQRNDGLGKIIRISPRRKGSRPYTIPSSNPFVRNSKYKDELYAVGFRNPHNLCFSKRGELFVTDAGRDNVEEVNIVKAGGNYGWSEREGIFVHKTGGGLLNGIAPLPANDASFRFIYPNVVVGHVGNRGDKFIGQALAGSCPVENGSPMSGTFLYANFPWDGALYYSFLKDMRKARTTGNPSKLTQAATYRAKIFFHHDNNPNTPPLQLNNLRDVIRREPGFSGVTRADIRFGQGSDGELYFSSKTVGWIYLIMSTKKG